MRDAVKWLHRWQALTAGLLLVSLAALTACRPIQPPAAGGGTTTEASTEASVGAIPEVVVSVDDTQVTIPDDFPGGIVRLTVQNNSSQDLDVGLARVREGGSVAEIEAMTADFGANLVPLMAMASYIVSFNPVSAGGSQTAIVDFRTGQFVVDATAHSEGMTPPGQAHIYGDFKAEKLVGVTEPQADVKVEMQDFAYVMPDEVKAGKLLWEYDNVGAQWHMQFFIKPNPDAAIEDVMAALMAEGDSSGPPPFEFVPFAGIPPLSEGERVWVEFSLDPGTYIAGCPLPDLAAIKAGDAPTLHLAHGMHRILTVK